MPIELIKDGAAKTLGVERGGAPNEQKRKFQLVRGRQGSQSDSTSSDSSVDIKRQRQIFRRPVPKQPDDNGPSHIPESRAKEMVNTFANPKYQSSEESGESFDDDAADDDSETASLATAKTISPASSGTTAARVLSR